MYVHLFIQINSPAPQPDCSIAELADLFGLLGDHTRLRIVLACVDEPIAVSDIAAQLKLSGALVSHHLRMLRAARIVKADRRGKQVFYAAADQHISSVLADMLVHIAEEQTEAD